jgi:hypothetical protein
MEKLPWDLLGFGFLPGWEIGGPRGLMAKLLFPNSFYIPKISKIIYFNFETNRKGERF